PLAWTLGAGLAACAAVAAVSFSLSAVPVAGEYRRLPARGTPAGPSVIFITVDTLRADHLGCYGYGRPTSPFVDSLAAGGARFTDPSAPAAWTKPSTGTLLTGLYPSRHGALYHGSRLHLPPGERTLAEAFHAAGYVTAGFVSNPNVKRVFDFDRGFDEFFDSPVEDTISLAAIRGSYFGRILMDLLRHEFNWKYENDVRRMNEHVLAWLEVNHEQPFFLYVHYIDPHIPYDPPAEYRRQFASPRSGFPLFNARKERVGRDLYDGEVRYTDDGIRELVEALYRHGRGEDALLVVTSDHGEEFFEHGVLGHGFSLYQPVIHVPLILHGPGIVPGTVVGEPVQILDLPATVLDLAGTGVTRLGDGISFAPLLAAPAAGREGPYFLENEFGQNEGDRRSFVFKGVRSGRWKLVLTEANTYFPPGDPRYGSLALYDLAADPGEERNLIRDEAHRDLVRSLQERLAAHLAFLDETGFRDAEPAAISAEILGNLKALGY
ncbi:MAG: sulfatase, partial [Planctomycetota bacterium]